MLVLFLQLLLAHIIGDFVFQPYKWVQSKEKKKHKSPYLYWHILVHTIALIVALQFSIKYWLGILIIIITHYFIDVIKLHLTKKNNFRWLFLWDQLAHLLVIAGVVYIYTDYTVDISVLYTPRILAFLVAILLVTVVSSVVIKVFVLSLKLNKKYKEIYKDNIGKYIGILERLLIFIFITTNNWEVVGFLLAAKSVFRFGEISKQDEYFIKRSHYYFIGTLLSFGLAILVGLGYNYFIKNVI